MPEAIKAKLIEKEYLKNDILRFKVEAKNIVQTAKPGNFIEIRVTDTTEPFLRRPISIYNLEKEEGTLEFIFQIKGEGTRLLSKKQEGDLPLRLRRRKHHETHEQQHAFDRTFLASERPRNPLQPVSGLLHAAGRV